LNGALSHIDLLRNPFSCGSCRGGVLVEFHLKGYQLVLRRALAFVVLLLLSERALALRATGA
jgi:hypothetical protein